MHLHIRRTIFGIFVLTFLISAPFVLLRSIGYKVDVKNLVLQSTGLISIKTEPKDASVTIDGKPIEEKTPVKIADLEEDNYEIKIQKTGYQEASFYVNVKSKIANFIDILLFAKQKSTKEISLPEMTEEPSTLLCSLDNNIFSVINKGTSLTFSQFNIENENITDSITIDTDNRTKDSQIRCISDREREKILFIMNNTLFLLWENNIFTRLNFTDESSKEEFSQTEKLISSGGRVFFLTKQRKLNELVLPPPYDNEKNIEIKKISIKPTIIDIAAKDNTLFFLSNIGLFSVKDSFADNEKLNVFTRTIFHPSDRFVSEKKDSYKEKLFIYDKDIASLIIFDTNTRRYFQHPIIDKNLEIFFDGNDSFIAASQNEIERIYFADGDVLSKTQTLYKKLLKDGKEKQKEVLFIDFFYQKKYLLITDKNRVLALYIENGKPVQEYPIHDLSVNEEVFAFNTDDYILTTLDKKNGRLMKYSITKHAQNE